MNEELKAQVAEGMAVCRGPALARALIDLLPYAETRCEDLWEAKDAGKEDPNYEGAEHCQRRFDEAVQLLRECGVKL